MSNEIYPEVTAEEMRNLCNSSDSTIKHILKYIKEAAKENCHAIRWATDLVSENTINSIMFNLTSRGFNVKDNENEGFDEFDDMEYRPHALLISW